MKKTVFTLMLIFVSAMFLNAQSITGKQWWTGVIADDGSEVYIGLSFEKDSSCTLILTADYEIKEDDVPITLTGTVGLPGTYTLKDKDLKLKMSKADAEVDLDYDIKGMDAKTKELMDKQIKDGINGLKNEFKNEMLQGLSKLLHWKVVSVESKQLIMKLVDTGDDLTFVTE